MHRVLGACIAVSTVVFRPGFVNKLRDFVVIIILQHRSRFLLTDVMYGGKYGTIF